MEKWFGAKWEKQVQNGICILGIYLVFRFALPLVYPFVIAGGIAVLLVPGVKRVQELFHVKGKQAKQWISTLCVLLFLVAFLIGFGALFMLLCGQLKRLFLSIPFYKVRCEKCARDCCVVLDRFLHWNYGASYAKLESWFKTEGWNSLVQGVGAMTQSTMKIIGNSFSVVLAVVITVIATFLLVKEYDSVRACSLNQPWGAAVCKVVRNGKKTLFAYIKAQLMIFVLNAFVCTVTFLVVGQPYYLVMGVFVAVFDLLPVLGAGACLLPYSIYLLIRGNVIFSFVVFVAYLVCVFLRQFVESKVIGAGVGLSPLCTIFCVYIGYQLFGIFGFVLGPVGLLLFREIRAQYPMEEKK